MATLGVTRRDVGSVIVGRRGSGKSTLLRALMYPLENVWLWDPLRNHLPPRSGELFRPEKGSLARLSSDGPFYAHVQSLAELAGNTGGVVLALDESDLCVRAGQQTPPALNRVIMQGRHLPERDDGETGAVGVGYILVTRRPAEISRNLSSQAQDFYFFRADEPADLEYAVKRGVPKGWLPGLARGEFVHVSQEMPAHRHTGPFTPCVLRGDAPQE